MLTTHLSAWETSSIIFAACSIGNFPAGVGRSTQALPGWRLDFHFALFLALRTFCSRAANAIIAVSSAKRVWKSTVLNIHFMVWSTSTINNLNIWSAREKKKGKTVHFKRKIRTFSLPELSGNVVHIICGILCSVWWFLEILVNREGFKYWKLRSAWSALLDQSLHYQGTGHMSSDIREYFLFKKTKL